MNKIAIERYTRDDVWMDTHTVLPNQRLVFGGSEPNGHRLYEVALSEDGVGSVVRLQSRPAADESNQAGIFLDPAQTYHIDFEKTDPMAASKFLIRLVVDAEGVQV